MKHDIVKLVRESALNVRASTMLARVQDDKRVNRVALLLLCRAAEALDAALFEMEKSESADWIRDYKKVKP